MMRSGASRAQYERERAHRARLIKMKARDVAERLQIPVADAERSLSRFSVIYESRDGRLCLFEDAQGHVSAVDSSRFA